MFNDDCLILDMLELDELGTIHPLKVRYILKMGDKGLSSFLIPFILKIKDYENNEDCKRIVNKMNGIKKIIKREMVSLDYILLDDDIYMRLLLIESLKLLYKTDNVKPYLINDISGFDVGITVNDEIKINHINWSELCSIVRKLMRNEEIKKEETTHEVQVLHDENKAILEEYKRLEEQYKKDEEERLKKLAEKNKLSLREIITVVAKDNGWNYNNIFDMTYYQLVNAYKSIMYSDDYNFNTKLYTSYKYNTENMELNHWSKKIKEDL